MKNNEVYTVYKVVATINGVYTSSDVRGDAMLTYPLEKTVRSETPIFVFTSLIRARRYSSESPILMGTSTTAPIPIERITSRLLAPYFHLMAEEAREFWRYVATHDKPPSHMGMLITTTDQSYVVYDFTPLKEVR